MQNVKFEFAHVGINAQTPEEGARMKEFFTTVFGYQNYREMAPSFFTSDNKMELMKIMGKGTLGHLGFFVDDMQAGIHYLEEMGYEMDYATERKDANGNTVLIFMKDEINGFRIHISVKTAPFFVEDPTEELPVIK